MNDMYVEDRQKAKQDKLSGKKKANTYIRAHAYITLGHANTEEEEKEESKRKNTI